MALFGRPARPSITYDTPVPAQRGADDSSLRAARELHDTLAARRREGSRLGDVLLGSGALDADTLASVLTRQSTSGKRLGELLVEFDLVDEDTLAAAVASQLGLEYVDLGRVTPAPSALDAISEAVARSLRALPLRIEGATLLVAVEDPLAPGLIDKLAQASRLHIGIAVASASGLTTALNLAYRTGDAIAELAQTAAADQNGAGADSGAGVDLENATAPVARIVQLAITQAIRDRASDVHIEPRVDGVRVRSRIDGVLHENQMLPLELAPALVSRIKVLAGMNIIERRAPQDGQMKFLLRDGDGEALGAVVAEYDLRISTVPVVHGEKVVIRILDKSRTSHSLSELGMPEDLHAEFSKLAGSPFGMVVCAGPTGSGKTTTLYATLDEIDSSEVNIMTVEDPVEYMVPTINQIQINEQSGVSFSSGLRAILRQDPDVVLVGEIRDVETAGIAVQAALTGHLVLSSVHASDAASALHRFLDMGVEPFLVNSSVLAVVGQRLVRRTCQHCVESYQPTDQELAVFAAMGGDVDQEFTRGAGCNLCASTGYAGRVGVYEVLTVSEEIRALVARSASRKEIHDLAVSQGMRPLRDEGRRLVETGVTTINEITRTVHSI